MASSETRKSNLGSRKRVCRSPSPNKSRPRFSTPDPCVARQPEPTKYINGLKPRELVDKILADMFHHHRWSMKDFIIHMVTEPPCQKYAVTETTRASHLSDAIFGQPIVLERLGSVSSAIHTTGTSDLVSRIQSELRGLINGDILGEFQCHVDIKDMDIPGLATQVQSKSSRTLGTARQHHPLPKRRLRNQDKVLSQIDQLSQSSQLTLSWIVWIQQPNCSSNGMILFILTLPNCVANQFLCLKN